MSSANILHLSDDERDELIRDYAAMSETERIDIHRKQTILLRRNRKALHDIEIAIAAYSMLLLALSQRRKLLQATAKKVALSDEAAAEIGRLRRLSITGSRKREGQVAKLIRLRWLEEIRKLRDEGCSWREVSTYIAKFHKKKISHTYLKNVFERLESQRLAREELFSEGDHDAEI